MNTDERMRIGRDILARLDPKAEENLRAALDMVAPGMTELVIAFGYGDVYARSGLALRDRQTATIAALTALGNAESQLAFHIAGGLSTGLAPQEIVEIIYAVTVFAGFPAGLNALAAARRVFAARNVKPTPTPVRSDAAERRERGLAALEATSGESGQNVLDALKDIAPEMAEFILDFSYGDVFSRPGLAPRRKELAVIAAAAARGTMRPQLKVHIAAGLHVGLGREEIVEAIVQMAGYAGFPAALNGLAAMREVFAAADARKAA